MLSLNKRLSAFVAENVVAFKVKIFDCNYYYYFFLRLNRRSKTSQFEAVQHS